VEISMDGEDGGVTQRCMSIEQAEMCFYTLCEMEPSLDENSLIPCYISCSEISTGT
jgi:hypothetical protein